MPMLAIALLQSVAIATPSPEATSNLTDDKTIVVIAPRASTTERALADCIARGCSPKDEIAASLAHAESQFLAGDYVASRRTLSKARSRNARYAKTLPVEVSNLVRASGRLASLNGRPDTARITSIDTLDILREGFGAKDERVLMQRLLIGDAMVKALRFDAAREIFNRVAKDAAETGQKVVEGHALLRIAVVYGVLASVDRGYAQRARSAITRITRTDDPVLAPFREAAATLQQRLASGPKALAAAKAGVAILPKGTRSTVATLVYAPPVDLHGAPQSQSTTVALTGDAEPQWIDVAFRITAEGTVRDVDVVRLSTNARGRWLELVEQSIAGRVYRPLAVAADSRGLARVERYSLIYDMTFSKGSRMQVRSSRPRLEVIDLTLDVPPG